MKTKRSSSALRLPPYALKSKISIKISNHHRLRVDSVQLRRAIRAVLLGEQIRKADISVAIVSDRAIHQINRKFLDHDEPTDVISFVLSRENGFVDGEIVVSSQTAASAAKRFGWTSADELLLYVVHGTLHLVGYDDLKASDRRKMRKREQHYLGKFGLKPNYEESS
jgi:probable rRNA maturation factor